MDLDYRAPSNAGHRCVGRLQTDADRERVVEGLAGVASDAVVANASAMLAGGAAPDTATLDDVVKRLSPRWFVVRDARASEGTQLVRPRTALTWMRGPLTRGELIRARAAVG